MKISGRSILKRLRSLDTIGRRLSRIRHFRGHGVHSPFVYYFVRKVLMTSNIEKDAMDLYNKLAEIHVGKKRSRQLSNAMIYCKSKTYSIDSSEGDFVILSCATSEDELPKYYETCHATGKTLIILDPYKAKKRNIICRSLILAHLSTSIDNRAFILFMNNELPKQHFIL